MENDKEQNHISMTSGSFYVEVKTLADSYFTLWEEKKFSSRQVVQDIKNKVSKSEKEEQIYACLWALEMHIDKHYAGFFQSIFHHSAWQRETRLLAWLKDKLKISQNKRAEQAVLEEDRRRNDDDTEDGESSGGRKVDKEGQDNKKSEKEIDKDENVSKKDREKKGTEKDKKSIDEKGEKNKGDKGKAAKEEKNTSKENLNKTEQEENNKTGEEKKKSGFAYQPFGNDLLWEEVNGNNMHKTKEEMPFAFYERPIDMGSVQDFNEPINNPKNNLANQKDTSKNSTTRANEQGIKQGGESADKNTDRQSITVGQDGRNLPPAPPADKLAEQKEMQRRIDYEKPKDFSPPKPAEHTADKGLAIDKENRERIDLRDALDKLDTEGAKALYQSMQEKLDIESREAIRNGDITKTSIAVDLERGAVAEGKLAERSAPVSEQKSDRVASSGSSPAPVSRK